MQIEELIKVQKEMDDLFKGFKEFEDENRVLLYMIFKELKSINRKTGFK